MFVQRENFGPRHILQYNFVMNNFNYPAHIHQFPEICYVIFGELEVTVNQRTYTAKVGDFIFIHPMQVHSYHTPEMCNCLVSAFSGMFVSDLMAEMAGKSGEVPVFRCMESVESYVRSTFLGGEVGDEIVVRKPPVGIEYADRHYTGQHFVKYNDPVVSARFRSCFYAILSEYLRVVPMVDASTDGSDALAQVLFYISKHYLEPITLADTAAALGYSSNYLSHRIQKSSGMNWNTLLGSLRVEHAQHLLHTHQGTMLDIALECGFNNERSFHRMFRRITGQSPGEYLRERG
ncbi:MAG: helix-turn-helix transcriptional regulator [Clostridia bacterium]|nr:helix-turn-helix transcriptional regulator [Clostridia bacterium]